jgi:hypothetical protein
MQNFFNNMIILDEKKKFVVKKLFKKTQSRIYISKYCDILCTVFTAAALVEKY